MTRPPLGNKMAFLPQLTRRSTISGYTPTVAILTLTLITTAASVSNQTSSTPRNDVTSPQRNVEDQVSAGLIPVFRMANFFVEDIVQQSYLTDLAEKIPMDTFDKFKSAFPDKWNEVVIYGIGFVVCAAIGLVSLIGFLLAALIFPCCRCCGRCGSKVPEEMASGGRCCGRSGRKSRCCTRTMEVFLVLACVGLILGNIPLYAVNEQFYPQLKTDFFVDANNSMTGLDRFIKQIPNEINQTVVVGFDDMETSVMKTLNDVPDGVLVAINNVTGVVTSLDELHAFTSNMTELNATMAATSLLAERLQDRTQTLYNVNFTVVNGSIVSKCGSNATCVDLLNLLGAVRVAVDFTPVAVSMSAGQLAVDAAIGEGLVDMVASSIKQLDDVSATVNQSISGSVAEVQENFDDVSTELHNVISDLTNSINQIDIDGARNTLMNGQEYTQLAADITYGVGLGLSIVMSLIIAFNVLGLLCGILLPPCRSQNRKRRQCRRDKSVGSHLLMTSVVLTFVFYWLYMLITAVFFIGGGVAQTEACRHLIYYKEQKSKDVLDIFDGWANSSLYDNVQFPVLPFDTYSQCSDNRTIYVAMSLDEKWNVSELTNTDEIDKAIDGMKTVKIDVPTVNLTNDELNKTLLDLDRALGPEVINFTMLYSVIDGTLFIPALNDVLSAMGTVDQSIVNLTDEVIQMNLILNASLDIETQRDMKLVKDLQFIEHYVGQAHFAQDAATLSSSQDTINTEGDVIVGKFVNNTADSIYDDVTKYSTDTINKVENSIANCRPVYDDATTLIDSICINSVYLINAWWYSLGWCLAFLVPSLVLAIHLETVYRYTSTTSSVAHMDSSPPIAAFSDGGGPETPPPSYDDTANSKGVPVVATNDSEKSLPSEPKPVPPPTKPKPKKFADEPEPDYN